MTQYEMTEKLSEKMNVSLEKAKAALVANEWDMLNAALLLEQARHEGETPEAERPASAHEKRRLGDVVRGLIAAGRRNRFEVRRGEETLLVLPVLVLPVLLLCAFWVCLPLLAIGLFAGCRYHFSGRELGRENVNVALDKAADAAERLKDAVTEA